jgi:arsenic resistance protein ArsH
MIHLRLRPLYACNRASQRLHSHLAMNGHGDLNNAHAARAAVQLTVDPAYSRRTFAIGAHEDDAAIRESYRPFLLPDACAANDWIADLELSAVLKLVESEILVRTQDRLRILVLYGSLRSR